MTDREERERAAYRVARLATDRGLSVAVAESLTSGQIAAAIGAAPEASEWFLGGVVAYTYKVKQRVLDVPPGPVVTADTAHRMALGVRRLTGADVIVAVTGAGGPDGQDGEPPGTVFIGTRSEIRAHVTRHQFSGEPAIVLAKTVQAALEALADALRDATEAPPNRTAGS